MPKQPFIYPEVEPIPAALQIDGARLQSYLRQNLPIFPKTGALVIEKFKHGQSNPTYLLTCSGKKFVLRKKPPGKLLPSAHAVEREYRVMSALQATRVPVPRTYLLCTDSSVIGTPFYICEFVYGRIFLDNQLSGMSKGARFAIYSSLNTVLARLHNVNIFEVGLGDFGRQGGYRDRLFQRWSKQYDMSKTKDEPYFDRLRAKLGSYQPKDEEQVSIIHGDYRLDNVVFHPTKNEIIAVLDWELSTIGDPMTDLASCALCYCTPPGPRLGGFVGVDIEALGIPSELEFVQAYCRNANKTKPLLDWNYYKALSLFRMAGIAQGIVKRAQQGNASSTDPSFAINAVSNMSALGVSILSSPDIFEQILNRPLDDLPVELEPFRDQFSPKFFELRRKLIYFVEQYCFAAERAFHEHLRTAKNRWVVNPVIEPLKEIAKELGLWNLFLPKEYPEGAGLTNMEYAPLCEIMGQCPGITPEACNCSAPDTGNMEVLAKYGNDYQKETYLKPLIEGKIRSCFGMTEIDSASADARNISCNIERTQDGDYVANGRKWWTSGAMDPRCKICILMAKTDPSASTYFQQSMFVVRMDDPGVRIVRHLTVFGLDDAPHGHAEVIFDNVRIPKRDLILGEGRGFEIAQGRLGPGRIHHCMRTIGLSERALQCFTRRALTRENFGRPIAKHGTIRRDIAECRLEIDQARLLTLSTASMMDRVGNYKARQQIAMIKVVAPRMACDVIDRAIQAHGGAGVSQDTELAGFWIGARALRLADGPDEVHAEVVARHELTRSKL